MSPDESKRMEQQRKHSEEWMAIKNAEIQQRNATLVGIASITALVLSGAWWLSEQAARNHVAPVARDIEVLKHQQVEMKARFDRMDGKQDKMLDILIELKEK